jgi:molybdenum cofactor guanylyltransferase
MRSTGVRLVTRPTAATVIQVERPYLLLVTAPKPPPYAAVVLAGGRGARLGGQAKPQLMAAVTDATERVVVGPPQPVPDGVLVVREEPPGGGPVAALRAGLEPVRADVVAVLAGDLPFVTADLVHELRSRLTGDGVLVIDDAGRDQLLLGVWRTAALRAALPEAAAHVPLRRVLAPLAVRRLRPAVPDDAPPPWTDCDTPADLARARDWAGG